MTWGWDKESSFFASFFLSYNNYMVTEQLEKGPYEVTPQRFLSASCLESQICRCSFPYQSRMIFLLSSLICYHHFVSSIYSVMK